MMIVGRFLLQLALSVAYTAAIAGVTKIIYSIFDENNS